MTISIDLTDSQERMLRTEAERLGVEPRALATAAVMDLLGREAEDFAQAAEYVIRKNRELYKRLG